MHQISDQSTFMVKGCIYIIMFDIVDTLFSYGRALTVCKVLQEFSNVKETTHHVIFNMHTGFLFCEQTFPCGSIRLSHLPCIVCFPNFHVLLTKILYIGKENYRTIRQEEKHQLLLDFAYFYLFFIISNHFPFDLFSLSSTECCKN